MFDNYIFISVSNLFLKIVDLHFVLLQRGVVININIQHLIQSYNLESTKL